MATNYYVLPPRGESTDIGCELMPCSTGGVLLVIGDEVVGRLRPDGTCCRYVVDDVRAAKLGLQLDHEGKLKCH